MLQEGGRYGEADNLLAIDVDNPFDSLIWFPQRSASGRIDRHGVSKESG